MDDEFFSTWLGSGFLIQERRFALIFTGLRFVADARGFRPFRMAIGAAHTSWVDCNMNGLLGLYHHRRPNVSSTVKLARFPIGHPNASMRCGHAWQVTLMQSVARREFEKVRHRGTHEVRMRRLAIAPAIDIGFHDLA